MIIIEKNIKNFITLFKIISNLAIETNITFKKDGIYVRAIHPSNTYFITLTMNSTMFEKYEIEKEVTYLINIEKFVSIMDIVVDKKINIDITEKGLIIKHGRKKFTLSYFVAEEDNRKRPDIRTVSKWKINSNNFFCIINNLINFSEVCTLEAKENLTIFLKSNLVNGEVIIDAEKIDSEDSTTSYDIGIINKIADIKEIFPDIRIGFSTDEPFIMRGKDNNIDFEFILAGRVRDGE